MSQSTLYEVMAKHLELVPTNHEAAKAIAVPPPDFDPRHADVSTLLRYGINPRPDSRRHPEAAKLWDTLTSQRYKYIVPTLTPRKEHRMRSRMPTRPSDTGTAYSPNWSGGLIFNPDTTGNDPFQQVQGQWVVPSVTPPTTGDGFWASVTWVGVDGYGSSDVMQLGTAQFVSTVNGAVSTETFAWIEWFTYSWQQISFSVNPGDTIFASIANGGVQNGVLQATGRITNVTQGTTTAPVVSAPPGTIFQGNVAECIMERPGFNNVLSTIPRFGEVVISGTNVCSKGGNYYYINEPVDMTSDGTSTGVTYVTGSVGPTTAMATWVASS